MHAVQRFMAIMMFVLVGSGAAAAETKVALVIGNSHYQALHSLKNPNNDVDSVSNALRKVGFSVSEEKDLDFTNFRSALQKFSDQARNADVGIVYFAGHGTEIAGENYLAPIDAKGDTSQLADLELVPARDLLFTLTNVRGLKIVLIDACRNIGDANQLSAERSNAVVPGLSARPIGQLENALILYSTKDGRWALDGSGTRSPFAIAFANRITQPGLELIKLVRDVRDDVLSATEQQEVPWMYASVSAQDFYFVPPRKEPPSAALALPNAQNVPDEKAIWQMTVQANTKAASNLYLSAFPNGSHVAQAKATLDGFTTTGAPAQQLAELGPETQARLAIDSVPEADWTEETYSTIAAKVLAQSSVQGISALARAGNLRAQLLAWSIYDSGLQTTQDQTEGFKFLQMAADQSDPVAEYILGYRYEFGGGVSVDYGKAIEYYQKSGEQLGEAGKTWSACAETNMAVMYLSGRGVKQDYQLAMTLFKRAADTGLPVAIADVGLMYDDGLGVQKDIQTALTWYHRAEGNAIAQRRLGIHYVEGTGVAKDVGKGIAWLLKAAQQHDLTAEFDLGAIRSGGYGWEYTNKTEARKWMTAAANHRYLDGEDDDEESVADAKEWLADNPL